MPEDSLPRKPLLILGHGYVGKAVLAAELALGLQEKVVITSRSGQFNATGDAVNPLLFDLHRKETWSVVEPFTHILWTFPAARDLADVALALEFFDACKLEERKVLVLGSTSSCLVERMGGIVDEDSQLDLAQPRVRAEEELRKRSAVILCLAGIYGPGRDPVQWLKRGLIKHGGSYINLIHISDIVKIVDAWRTHSVERGRRILASDGRHRRWLDLIPQLKAHGLLAADFALEQIDTLEAENSKRVSHERLCRELYSGPFHAYPEQGL